MSGRQALRGINALRTLGVLPLFLLPLSLSLPLPLPFNPARGLGSAISSPSVPKRILVHFEVKVEHFGILVACIVSAASYCTAIDLFYVTTALTT